MEFEIFGKSKLETYMQIGLEGSTEAKVNIDDRLIVMVEDTVSILNHIMENSKYTTVHISTRTS